MKRQRPYVTISLTKKQVQLLQPFFTYAMNRRAKEGGGLIFAEPKQNLPEFCMGEGVLTCAFVPKEYADQMVELSRKANTLIAKKGLRK